ncbi:MAG: TonB-dependent receptor [Alistipes sp.]|nr:TonB-dependent receptor [Alistipes sp.]
MRNLILLILATMLCCYAAAQQTVDDVYQYKIDEQRLLGESINSDTLLFFRALHQPSDNYGSITDYRFSFVDFSRRGIDYFGRNLTLDGVEVRRANLPALRRLGLAESNYSGIFGQSSGIGGYAGADEFSSTDGVMVDSGNVGLFFSGRGYLGGVRATLHRLMRRGLSLSLYASVRAGDDLYVDGIFQQSADVAFRLSRTFDSGAQLSFVALSTIGNRGLRYGSTAETFTLTRDNLYNPSWGYQSGQKRNSRTRRDFVPFATVSYTRDVGNSSRMTLSAGGDYGWRGYTSLGWYDAATPRPDNYRYLPSYYADTDIAEVVADRWRNNDARYTQINWDELYQCNRYSTRGAVYAVEESIERIARADVVLRMRSELSEAFTLNYGLRGGYSSTRHYKQMNDLLGAAYFVDVDYYLLDDDTFSNKTSNNIRNANQLILEGDRFGYDYALSRSAVSAEAGLKYALGKWNFTADMSFGHNRIVRNGYFEKELYAGEKSYGRSDVVAFSPYAIRVAGSVVMGATQRLEVGVMHSAVAPEEDNIFLNPQYNNRIADNLQMQRHLSAELGYSLSSEVIDFSATAYLIRVSDQISIYRAYDDLSATYCDVDIEGLATLSYGIESAAKVHISRNLTAEATFAAGRYTYFRNPLVTLYADYDNRVISSASESYMGDCHLGGAPQISASLGVEYMTYRGWAFSLGGQLAALRYVEPSALCRTERIAHQASTSEEIYRSFITQQRLDDAITVDASLSRWFNIGRQRLSLTLSVRNLLDNKDIVYGGYESSRIRHYKSGARDIYSPQDDILTYAYPRTFYAVVSYKF